MNEKWIIVNNITSLEKLYIITKAIKENDVTKSNNQEMLMQILNENGAKRKESNSHPLNYVLFYHMVYFDEKSEKYQITENGEILINNFSTIKENNKKCAEFFLKVFMEIEFPNPAVKVSEKYQIKPFKFLFRLLSEDSIERRLYIDEFKYLLSLAYTNEDYERVLNIIKKFRKGEFQIEGLSEISQVETILSGWEKQFHVIEKQDDYMQLSKEIRSLIPVVVSYGTEQVDISEIFTRDCLKKVIEEKLIDEKNQKEIENDIMGESKKGYLAGCILMYYGLSKDTNKYKDVDLSVVAELFKLQSNERIRQLGEVLSDSNNDTKNHNYIKKYGTKPIRKIYVGAPGTGKSYAIKELLGENVSYERIVFHPEYDYNDFVGQIRPNIDDYPEKLYDFYPGPLTRMLKKAINNTNEDHYLVIEEMTRGNCSAIFGNIFQLLDEGYEINDEYISKYIYEGTGKNLDDPIYLPENLHIIGTINSSDQNVYPLDTAFKRRFDFEYIDVEKNKDKIIDFKICDMCWSELYVKINKFIINELELEEDKQVGPFFIKQGDDISKLFIYLWEDVNKYCEVEKLFNENIKSLSELLRKVEEEDASVEKIFNAKMFKSSTEQEHIDDDNNIEGER